MNLFALATMFSFCMLFQPLPVNGAPTLNGVPQQIVSTTKKSTTSTKASSTSAKSSTTTSKSSIATIKSSSKVALSTTQVSSTLSATYPTPTVPIGAAAEPFATVDGRMFQTQSKTQYFAGTKPHVMIRINGFDTREGVNAWWLGHLQNNSDVFNVFTDLALVNWPPTLMLRSRSNRMQSQLKVARVWGFGETNDAATASGVYYQVLNSSGQYFNFDSNTGRSESLDS